MLLDIKNQFCLQAYNSFAVSSYAKSFLQLKSVEAIQAFAVSEYSKEKFFILAGGSNTLLASKVEQLVVQPDLQGVVFQPAGEFVFVTAAAGENWHKLVKLCLQQGYVGLQNLALIPGTVGAAPIQNIGAYGVEFEQVFHSLKAIEIGTGNEKVFNKSDCQFAYRDSVFKHELQGKYIITEVTLKLEQNKKLNTSYGAIEQELQNRKIVQPTAQDVFDVVVAIRQSKLPDPDKLGNAGSFFKNPMIAQSLCEHILLSYPELVYYPMSDGYFKLAAGWLIEQAGFKGKALGQVGVYDKQALVLVNHGGGSAEDIMSLAEAIQKKVYAKFAVSLEPEVRYVC